MDLDAIIKMLESKMQKAANTHEFWMARDIMAILGYSEWRNFKGVIEDAKSACDKCGAPFAYHFVDTTEEIMALLVRAHKFKEKTYTSAGMLAIS